MDHYAGIDVSLERSFALWTRSKVVNEVKISSEPAAQVAFFEALGFALKRIELGEDHCRNGCMRG